MLYISYIKLVNFIQLKGRTYERHYEPNKVYMFMGPNGSGKSSIVVEHDPKPVVHGSTTIIRNKEGIKELVFKDTHDPSIGYKVVHFYVPKEDKPKSGEDELSSPPRHSVKSFLYRLYNDEIAEIIVDGSTNEFRTKMRSIFDVDYDSIKITGIGMKYGGTMFDILSCSDSDRYNYIKSVLSNLEEVKEMENHITTSLQVSNRRLKDLKSILGDISNTDFSTEMDKLKLDITDYNNLTDTISKERIYLDTEFEKMNQVSPTKRNELFEEYKIVKEIHDIVKDIPDFISKYKGMKEDLSRLNFTIANLEEEKAKYSLEKFNLTKNTDVLDRTNILANISREIQDLSKLDLKEYNLEELDKAIDTMNSIHMNITVLSSNTDANINEYAAYNSEEHIIHYMNEISSKINELVIEKESISELVISDHERGFLSMSIPIEKNCDTCPLFSYKQEISNKMDKVEQVMSRTKDIFADIENLRNEYNKISNMRKLFTYYRDILTKFDSDNMYIKEFAAMSVYDKIYNCADMTKTLRAMKNSSMQLYRLRDLQNKKKEIESTEDIVSKINDVDTKIRDIEFKLNEAIVLRAELQTNSLQKIKEEYIYKYANNINEVVDTLRKDISDLSELSSKSEHLQKELRVLDSKYVELKDMVSRKTEELTKLMVEKERYDQTSSQFKFELEDNKKMSVLRIALTKKIPTILLNSYMIYVKNEANEILLDIDRYSVLLPKISYENNRNEFDIQIRDYDEVKSCAVLSKGESSLISLAIVLPLIYMSTTYGILKVDEIDSTLDTFMKQKVFEILLTLPEDKISQVLMVTHETAYADNEKVEIIRVGG